MFLLDVTLIHGYHLARMAEAHGLDFEQPTQAVTDMIIHDGLFSWEGFGGLYQLAAGSCRLCIMDLSTGSQAKVAHLRPILVVVSDLPGSRPQFGNISIRSCASHIATTVTQRFGIDPHRMTYIEYYPPSVYGDRNQHVIEARFEAVDFTWFEDKAAMHPRWRPLASQLREIVAGKVSGWESSAH